MKPWSLKPAGGNSVTIEGSQLPPAGYCYNLSNNQMRFLIELLESLGFERTSNWWVKEGRHYNINNYYPGNTLTVQWKDMAFPSHEKDFGREWEDLFEKTPGFEGFHVGIHYGI